MSHYLKLEDFRLETYTEREVLMTALSLFERWAGRYPFHIGAVNALRERLARTECQPGGCEYCNGEEAQS